MVVTHGVLPRRVAGMVQEWATTHRDELRDNWQRAMTRRRLVKIQPLDCGPAMHYVKEVHYVADYRLRVRFDDEVEKLVDLADELYGEMFEPLRDKTLFAQARLDPDSETVVWPNGPDVAPEWLYETGRVLADSAKPSAA